MTQEELARLKAIAFGESESEFDMAFWSDGGKTVQSLITEIERLQQQVQFWKQAEAMSKSVADRGLTEWQRKQLGRCDLDAADKARIRKYGQRQY